jgi:hypothetical protein
VILKLAGAARPRRCRRHRLVAQRLAPVEVADHAADVRVGQVTSSSITGSRVAGIGVDRGPLPIRFGAHEN